MAVYLAIYGPKKESLTFWLAIIGWALGFAGNGQFPLTSPSLPPTLKPRSILVSNLRTYMR